MDNLTIKNLSNHQCNLLDKIWSIDSEEELDKWKKTLSTSDKQMCDSLIQLIIIEARDEIVEDDMELTSANSILKKYML